MRCALFTSREMHTHASWYSCENVSKTLNKVVVFVFFVHKTIPISS